MARANPRAAAQRATARAVREGRTQLPSRITSQARRAPEKYARAVLEGREPLPPKGSLESRVLARWASFARWNKADPAFLAAFQQYFYHDEKRSEAAAEEAEEEMADYEDEADEE